MPLIEISLPMGWKGSGPDDLASSLSGLSIRALGGDPNNPAAQEITRVEVIRPNVFAANDARDDRVRVTVTVPLGCLSTPRKEGLVREITRLFAEDLGIDPHGRDAIVRIWVTVVEPTFFAAGGQAWGRREIARWARPAPRASSG